MAVCLACGTDDDVVGGTIDHACDRCVANAHARAERTVEQRQQPKVKPEKPRACVGLAPEDVCR